MPRLLLIVISVVLACVALGFVSVRGAALSSVASWSNSSAPADGHDEQVIPGGATPVDDDDDFAGFESGDCLVASNETPRATEREESPSISTAESSLGPAPGYAQLRDRPPRSIRG